MKFSYGVRVRYVEVLNESIIDLSASKQSKDKVNKKSPVDYLNEYEGPSIKNADW